MLSNLTLQGMRQLRTFLQPFIRVLLCILAVLGPRLAVGQDAPFQGTWVLSKEQSDFGIFPANFESLTMSVSRAGAPYSVTETITYSAQEEKLPEGDRAEPKLLPARTVERSYNVWQDGRYHQDIGLKGCKSIASKKAGALDIKLECTTDEGYPVVVTERWTLNKGGQALEVGRHMASLQSSGTMILRFRKGK